MPVGNDAATTEQDVTACYNELVAFFGAFAADFEVFTGLTLRLDDSGTYNLAQSYVYDLGRYTQFHEIEVPDRARRAAYICKWIMRFHPILVPYDVTELEERHGKFAMVANELFAIYVVSGLLKIELEASLSPRMFNMTLYSLRYRASSEDTFILFFAQLCQLA